MKLFYSGLLLFSCVISLPQTYAASEIKLCYEDASVFPWITGDDKGLVINELHLVEKALNLKLKMVRLPWKRCQAEAKAGNYDGIIAASFNKDRAVWGVYPTDDGTKVEREYRLHTDTFFVYARKETKIKWENGHFENLEKNSVGVQLGYSVGNDLKDAGYSTFSSFSSPYDILKEMDTKNIQVAVLQNHETTKTLNEHPKLNENIVRLEKPFKVADQYLLLTRAFYEKNTQLSKSIWSTISKTRKSPEYIKSEKEFLSQNN